MWWNKPINRALDTLASRSNCWKKLKNISRNISLKPDEDKHSIRDKKQHTSSSQTAERHNMACKKATSTKSLIFCPSKAKQYLETYRRISS